MYYYVLIISCLILLCLYLSYRYIYLEPYLKEQQQQQISQQLEQKLTDLLTIYDCKGIEGSPLEWKRLGRDNDGGYVVPVCTLEQSDVLLGYGIFDDDSFEQHYISLTGKPAYGFDCTTYLESKPKLTIVRECVTDDPINCPLQPASTFSQHVQRYGLTNKKIFVKMDIEGGEFNVVSDIVRHAHHITGITMEVHIDEDNTKKNASIKGIIRLLESFQKDFYLVHLHMNNCASVLQLDYPSFSGGLTRAFEITFIHKSLVKNANPKPEFKGPTSLDQSNIPNGTDVSFVIRHIPKP